MWPSSGTSRPGNSGFAWPMRTCPAAPSIASCRCGWSGRSVSRSRRASTWSWRSTLPASLAMGNYSGGCWSWQPWVALEQSAQGDQRVDAVLACGRDVGAHGQERLGAVQGPPAPGDLLLQFDHADVALGQIIGRWDPQVLQEPQDLA